VDEVGDGVPHHGHDVFNQVGVAAGDEHLGVVLFGQFLCDANDRPRLRLSHAVENGRLRVVADADVVSDGGDFFAD